MNDQTGEYTEPPAEVLREMERTLTLKVTSAQAILDTLHQVDEFLNHDASPAARAELHTFCTAHGWNTDAFLDGLGFQALSLRWALDAAITDHAGDTADADQHKETT